MIDWKQIAWYVIKATVFFIPRLFNGIKQYFNFSYTLCKTKWTEYQQSQQMFNGLDKFLGKTWILTIICSFFILFPVAIICLLYLFIHFVLPILTVLVIIGAVIMEQIAEEQTALQEKEQAEQQIILRNVRYELFIVICELGTLMPLKPLHSETEIVATVLSKSYGVVVESKLLKSHGDFSADAFALYKTQVQAVISRHLADGQVMGAMYASFDGETPLCFVESVFDAGIYLAIRILIVDNPAAVAYVCSHSQHSTQDAAQGYDKDFGDDSG